MCPFCGKTYKRLKSHLPHCKAAASSATPPISHEAAKTRASSYLSSPKEEKPQQKLTLSARLQSKKSQTVSAASEEKKQKLSEQIKAAIAPPSSAVSPTSQRPTTSKSKKTTVHDFIQSAGPQKNIKGAPKRSSSEKDVSKPALQPTGHQGSSNIKISKKKATQALSLSQNDEPNQRTEEACERNHAWVTTGRKTDDLSVNTDAGIGQSKITLQDVKAALGRDRKAPKSRRPSIPVHDPASDPSSSLAPSAVSLPTGNRDQQPLSTSSSSPSEPASTGPPRPQASPQLAPASPTPPLPHPFPTGLASQVHRAVTGLSTGSLTQSTSPKLLLASVTSPGAPDRLIKDETQAEDRKTNIPDSRTKGWLLERRKHSPLSTALD